MRKSSPIMGVKIEMLAGTAEALRDSCALRFQEWVRERMPVGGRKRLAAALGASPETVDTWLDGGNPRLPGTKHLLAAFAAFGPEFAAYVLAPCGTWTRYLLFEARAAQVRQEIEGLRRELNALGEVEELGVVTEAGAELAASEAALERAVKKSERLISSEKTDRYEKDSQGTASDNKQQ